MNFIVRLFVAEQRDSHLFDELSHREKRILDLDLTDNHLDELRGVGDPEVDVLVQQYAHDDEQHPRRFVRELIAKKSPTDPAIQIAADLPPWASSDLLRVGQEFLNDHGLEIASALFYGSLPYSYTAAKGAHVLARTAQLTTGKAARRVAETGMMLLDLMAPDEGRVPLDVGTRGWSAARGVRLFHAAVRHMLLHDPKVSWDLDKYDVPINQEDLLGTLVVFTVVVVDSLEAMGLDLHTAQGRSARDAYVHFWLVVGHLLGIDYSRLRRGQLDLDEDEAPLSIEELRLVQAAVLRRNAEISADGQTLTDALLHAAKQSMPFFARRYPVAATHQLVPKEYADILGVPAAGIAHGLFDLIRPITRLISPRLPGSPTAMLARKSTQLLYSRWIKTERGEQPPWRAPSDTR